MALDGAQLHIRRTGCLGLLGFESAKEFWEHHPLYHSWKFKGWACQFGNRAPPDRGKA